MSGSQANRVAVRQWSVVLTVGVLVVALVVGLKLIPRLNAGQKVLDGARPAFTGPRVAADRAGIDIVSHVVDMADPIVGHKGGAAAEVPAVVGYVAKRRHVSRAQAVAAMRAEFPHTTALLTALPLSSVTKELPGLEAFLAKTLALTPAKLEAALEANFPALARTITNLPTVTRGWSHVQGIGAMTRFSGPGVESVPEVRDYFSDDLVAAVQGEQAHFRRLDGTSRINWIAPLLLIVGLVVVALAGVMIVRNRRGVARTEAIASTVLVPVVGLGVVGLVLALALIPRVNDGQKLIDGLKPAMTADRVAGDRAGIRMVSAIVDTADPIMTARGGAAAEVPQLLALVSRRTGLSVPEVLASLQHRFPHTTALLQAIPLTGVTAELPRLGRLVGPALGAVPHLAQTIKATPLVTSGWLDVPGTEGATRFDGRPIRTVPDVRDSFSADVIPVLEHERAHFGELASRSKIDFIGTLVLAVGLIVIVFGLSMVAAALRRPRSNASPVPVRPAVESTPS